MDVPTVVADALGDETVAAHVPLKGEDALYVTPSRSLVYRSEGILSDESVSAYPHDAERVAVDAGRRNATISLDYGTRGEDSFSVPGARLDEALHPVLAGVLNAAGVTQPGETVKRTYRFNELTIVVTSDRVVKHIGSAVWDHEYEEVPFEAVTDLVVEEGNVSSQLVLTTHDHTERIKAPSEGFREVEESVREALFAYYDVDSIEAFRELMAAEEPEGDTVETHSGDVSFEESVDPIDTSGQPGSPGSSVEEQAAQALEESGFTSAADTVEATLDREALEAELEALEAGLEEQARELERQREHIQAIRELIPDQ